MSSTEQVQRNRPGRHTAPVSGQRKLTGRIAAGVAVLVAAGAGTFVVTQAHVGRVRRAAGRHRREATVISTDGTVVDGQQLTTALHIKANNVKVVNSTVRHTGTVAIRVFPGFSGTVVDNTEVFCAAKDMVGVGNGNYTATRVKVHGCGIGFQHFAGGPAVVTDSTVDDQPYTASYVFTEPGKKHATTGAGLVAGPVKATKPWPGPDNTGVPVGTVLSPFTGQYVITVDNTVIDGKILTDCLDIKAKNVTIKRSKITCKNKGG